MPNLPVFNHPFLVGFDELEAMLNQMTKSAEGFPPYNIEQCADGILRITLAVAGYAESDLEMTQEDNRLVIRGHQNQTAQRQYLHRGIAARAFVKSFVMAEGMAIEGARLENGLLAINLKRPVPLTVVKKIEIRSPRAKPVVLLKKKKGA